MVWKPQQNKQITMSLLVNCGVKRHALLTASTFRSKSYAIHFSPTAYPTSNYYYHQGSLPKILQPWHFIPKKGKKGIPKGKPGSSSKHPSFQVAKRRQHSSHEAPSPKAQSHSAIQGPWLVGTIGLSAKRRPKAASSLPENKKTKVGSDSIFLMFPGIWQDELRTGGVFLCFLLCKYIRIISNIYIYSHGKSTFFWKSGVMSPFWGGGVVGEYFIFGGGAPQDRNHFECCPFWCCPFCWK